MRRLWSVALCGLIWCQLLEGARADLAPPGQQACLGKATGDACDGGLCSAHTCSKLDYTHWDRDAEVAPPTVSYDCVLCTPSAGAGGSASKAGTGGAAQGAGGSASKAGTGGAAQGGAGGSAQTAGGAAPDTGSGCGSCSAGGTGLGLRGAALSFALFMGLFLGGRLRRKPR